MAPISRLTDDREILAAPLRRWRLPGLRVPLRLRMPSSVDAVFARLDAAEPGAEDRIPYWAELWPSADALTRFLLAGRGPRRPGRALEIGCGLGLVGLAALRLGWSITLSDRDADACRWAAANCAANGLDPACVRRLDWRDAPPGRFDTLLASDVLYEKAFGEPLARFLEEALAPGGAAWLAEPYRPAADASIQLLARRFDLRLHGARGRAGERWQRVRILQLRRA